MAPKESRPNDFKKEHSKAEAPWMDISENEV